MEFASVVSCTVSSYVDSILIVFMSIHKSIKYLGKLYLEKVRLSSKNIKIIFIYQMITDI